MSSASKAVSVLLIDPSPVHRGGVRKLLESASFTIADEVAAVAEAVRPARLKASPDLVLLSHHQSAGQLSELISTLRGACEGARLVVLTSDLSIRQLSDALRAGANGFLSSDISKTALLQSINLVLTGERVLPSNLAGVLMSEYGDGTMASETDPALDILSNREIRILKCLMNGLSNKLIATKLAASEETVKAHVKIILRKTSAKNRTQAAIWAVNHGLELRTTDRGRAPERRSTASRFRG